MALIMVLGSVDDACIDIPFLMLQGAFKLHERLRGNQLSFKEFVAFPF